MFLNKTFSFTYMYASAELACGETAKLASQSFKELQKLYSLNILENEVKRYGGNVDYCKAPFQGDYFCFALPIDCLYSIAWSTCTDRTLGEIWL